MAKLDTVKVKADSELGFMIINKSDFDEAKHELYNEEKPKAARKPRAKTAAK